MEVDLNFVKIVIADLTLENKLLQAHVVELQRQLEATKQATKPVDEKPSI